MTVGVNKRPAVPKPACPRLPRGISVSRSYETEWRKAIVVRMDRIIELLEEGGE